MVTGRSLAASNNGWCAIAILSLVPGIVLVAAVLMLGRWILVRPMARAVVDRGGPASIWVIGVLIAVLVVLNVQQINASPGGLIEALDLLVFLLCIGWAFSHRR